MRWIEIEHTVLANVIPVYDVAEFKVCVDIDRTVIAQGERPVDVWSFGDAPDTKLVINSAICYKGGDS